jgi:hypothetical protein
MRKAGIQERISKLATNPERIQSLNPGLPRGYPGSRATTISINPEWVVSNTRFGFQRFKIPFTVPNPLILP